MVGRNPARYLAPIVLIATAVGVYLIVTKHVSGNSATTTATQVHDGTARPRPPQSRAAAFYTVKPGDSLTSIATKTGVSIATLEQLNPSLNPDSLQTGQRIRLRR